MNRIRLLGFVLFISLGIALAGLSRSEAGKNAAPTFTKDIAPIFFKNCAECHRPGEIAPMSLMNYKEVRPWAKAIREKVVSREMPPWHADPAHGQWSNDKRMSQKDIDAVTAWIDAGAPEGDPKAMPAAPKFAKGWQIGEPDLVINMPEEFTVPAEGAVPYMYFTVPSNFTEDRYVTAMEARAGDLSVVHHIVVYVRDPKEKPSRRQDIGTGLLGALSPGNTPFIASPGTAKLIKAGSNIVFQMHYTPSGKATKDRSMIGLKFSKAPVDKVITTTAAWDARFEIPAHAQNHEVRATYLIEEDVDIISLMPHMHLRGKDYVYIAHYPDGRKETLLSVPRYDFGWQVYYYPVKPLRMPKGTKIETIAHYDNSTKNPQNPDPAKSVRFGEQTWEEMMNGFFDFVPVQSPAKQAASSSSSR
ncbi:MAG TPA: cytochrome c [Blastocatellia bacterium]|nr:cytochrome c [Blastocatellia bacterium]HMV82794.1 cytochrome c [Blastocatellia bacterium]HMX27425.1 cytochrome c [Blastocatellia bacterium]HMY74016.1 cytochrome c [Blastocatellia bacterium]HMZ23094.1 cytochrome c [Blastocatellia bacterium]